MAATSMDIFLLVTDNLSMRIWEVASPHRGLSFSGPTGMGREYAVQAVSGNTNCPVQIIADNILLRRIDARITAYVMSSVS